MITTRLSHLDLLLISACINRKLYRKVGNSTECDWYEWTKGISFYLRKQKLNMASLVKHQDITEMAKTTEVH